MLALAFIVSAPATASAKDPAGAEARSRASNGWRGRDGLGMADPSSKSIALRGGWRIFTGGSVVTRYKTGAGGSKTTWSRTIGVGKDPTVDPERGNIVLGQGRAIQFWTNATFWRGGNGRARMTGLSSGKSVTTGTETRVQVHPNR